MTNQGAPISVSACRATIGGFFGGDRVTLNPTLRMRVGEDADDARSTYQRNDIDLPGARSSPTWCARASRTRSRPRMFIQALVQYNDRADLWSMNLRFGWLQAANTGLFVVYTDTRGLYDLSDRPERDGSLVYREILVHVRSVSIETHKLTSCEPAWSRLTGNGSTPS